MSETETTEYVGEVKEVFSKIGCDCRSWNPRDVITMPDSREFSDVYGNCSVSGLQCVECGKKYVMAIFDLDGESVLRGDVDQHDRDLLIEHVEWLIAERDADPETRELSLIDIDHFLKERTP